jgi:predicted phosphate transport protein (TIGR00153 family)
MRKNKWLAGQGGHFMSSNTLTYDTEPFIMKGVLYTKGVNMFSIFLPKDFNFFDLFERQASYAVEAACYFKELVSKGSSDELSMQKMKDIEHQGDNVTHDILDRLNKTFITPFDREDIHALAKELDDIIDMIYTITNRMRVYKLSGIDKNLVEFASVIEDSVRSVASAVKGMRDMKHSKSVSDACVEVNRLENVGDSMRDAVLAELFDMGKDPIHVIKWKEIYQDAETVLDICEDVAHVVQSILVKQA